MSSTKDQAQKLEALLGQVQKLEAHQGQVQKMKTIKDQAQELEKFKDQVPEIILIVLYNKHKKKICLTMVISHNIKIKHNQL